jgi:hypothetical protein
MSERQPYRRMELIRDGATSPAYAEGFDAESYVAELHEQVRSERIEIEAKVQETIDAYAEEFPNWQTLGHFNELQRADLQAEIAHKLGYTGWEANYRARVSDAELAAWGELAEETEV